MPPKASSRSSGSSGSPNSNALKAFSKAWKEVHTIINNVKDFENFNDLVGKIYKATLPKEIKNALISILLEKAHKEGIRTDSH